MSARRSVFLCGFSGGGKSETGRILAVRLGLEFIDIDEAVEAELGMSIPDAFDTVGETEFRTVEREAIGTAGRAGIRVIALGGGAVAERGTLEYIKRRGLVVYLRVSPETAFMRLQDSYRRPKLNGTSRGAAKSTDDLRAAIVALMAEREPFYR
ncbi:MAG: shikimate kinase, partial [candidate division Zixibacteria bacterium]|nr:shikimate kinase [candidate division Zixibacteria bacterium]